MRWDVGKDKRCHKGQSIAKLRPIVVDTPQNAFFGFLFNNVNIKKAGEEYERKAGSRPKTIALNVPYKNLQLLFTATN